jgi:hypothetical protein
MGKTYDQTKDIITYSFQAKIDDEKTSGNYCRPFPITFKLCYNWKISTVDGFESIEAEM